MLPGGVLVCDRGVVWGQRDNVSKRGVKSKNRRKRSKANVWRAEGGCGAVCGEQMGPAALQVDGGRWLQRRGRGGEDRVQGNGWRVQGGRHVEVGGEAQHCSGCTVASSSSLSMATLP
eukprot:358031-Chlamydomonas_euryale.AAC.2